VNALKEILSENDGSLSYSRIASAAILIFVLAKNLMLTAHTGVAQPLDWTEITAVLGSLGLKVLQKPFEQPAAPTTPPVVPQPSNASPFGSLAPAIKP
jgi:hypothetical protein